MISTHILDTSLGNPASDVSVQLDKKSASGWELISQETTNNDGRIVFKYPSPDAGIYRLTFKIENYFAKLKQEHFFQNIEITFKVTDGNRKYHVPLLLNPYGYSTYRGS